MTWRELELSTLRLIGEYTSDKNIDSRVLLKLVTIAGIAHDKARSERDQAMDNLPY